MPEETTTQTADTATQATGTVLGTQATNPQQQTQAAPSPISHNDWLVEGKFATGLSGRLSDDLKPYEGSIKKFEGTPIQDVLKSYGELEKKLGQRPRPPGPDAKPEEIAAWRQLVGTPEKPEDYKIERPETVPEELWNEPLAKGFAEVAHKLNLSSVQAAELMGWWNNTQMEMIGQHQQAQAASREELAKGLQTEWGDRFSANINAAQRVASLTGLDVNDPEIGDNPAVIKALHKMSALISDDKQVTGGSGGPNLTMAQQADDIQSNPSNPLHADYMGKNGEARQLAAAEKLRALRAAAAQR